MRIRLAIIVAFVAIALGFAAPAYAQSPLFSYQGFSDPSDPQLTLAGSAKFSGHLLRLVEYGDPSAAGAVWRTGKVDVGSAWETRVAFQILYKVSDAPEGLAFVIQGDSGSAVGGSGRGLGFAGIPRSLAVAVHSAPRADLGEPNQPFVSVHSRGRYPNSATMDSSLGQAVGASQVLDYGLHELRVRHTPPAGAEAGSLEVFVDDTKLLTVSGLDLGELLSLDHDRAWLGITAANGALPNFQHADVRDWHFGPVAAPERLTISGDPTGEAAIQPNIGPIEAKLRDAAGRPVIAVSDTDVVFSSDSAPGRFGEGRDAKLIGQPLVVTIPAGASSARVLFGTRRAGRTRITATASGLPEAGYELTVEPGPASELQFKPKPTSAVAGEPMTVGVISLDRFDNERGGVPDATLTIEPDGSCQGLTCTAAKAGPHRVTASSGTLHPTWADFVVRPAPLAAMRLDPATATVAAGQPRAFRIEGADAYGNAVPVTDAKLAISPDGSCTGTTCTAETAGPHTVTATLDGVQAEAQLEVTPGPLASLELSPGSATVVAGNQHAFKVQAVDAFGNAVPVADAKLAITPDGSCTGASCTANKAGAHTVTASLDGATATAELLVTPGPLDRLLLSPPSATVTAGSEQGFEVEGRDAYGNARPALGAVLDITPDGSCAGTTCIATKAGLHKVTAKLDRVTASAQLQVTPGPVESLQLTPATVAAGNPHVFMVEGSDAYGNVRPVLGATLEISPDGSCTGSGCMATTAGPHTVTATLDDVKGSTELTVRPGPVHTLRLGPEQATITAGEQQTYTVEALDGFGNAVPADGVELRIAPDGACSELTCSAETAGEHTVTARVAGTARATASLDVRPRPAPTSTPTPTPTPAQPAKPRVSKPVQPMPVAPEPARVETAPESGAQPTAAPRWVFTGFHRPLRNGKLNRVKRAVTLRWRLTDDAGAPVTTLRAARLTVASIPCRGKRIAEDGRARAYGLNASADGSYRLKWKPRRRDAGSCKRLRLDLPNGISRTVDIKVQRRSA